jgi:endonuclease III related protein
MKLKLVNIYRGLLSQYGRQAWWPAEQGPFEVMLGAILTQNTSWTNVEKALCHLKQQIPLEAERLLALSSEVLEQCLKPAGYFRVKAQRLRTFCHWYLAQEGYNGLQQLGTQELRDALLRVHGIGPETADDIVLYAFDRPVFVIDNYTRRLLQRLQMIVGNERYEDLRSLCEAHLPKQVDLYKQFHALIVLHAKQHCYKNKPACGECRLSELCFYSTTS